MEQTIRLAIDGMHCANCVANVEKHYRARQVSSMSRSILRTTPGV